MLDLHRHFLQPPKLYEDKFKGELDATLGEKLCNEGVPATDVEKLGAPSYENLMRFVIDNVDGVVVGSESADQLLVAYAREQGKMVLDYQSPEDADFYDNYDSFYEKLF